MSDKAESVEKKERVGILRKRENSMISNASSSTAYKPRMINRAKPNEEKVQESPKSLDSGIKTFPRKARLDREKPLTAPILPKKSSLSASPSTTTLDSRVTASSHGSLSHKPGHLPSYLRNKSDSKNIIAVQVQCNKKQFTQIKKELNDIQNKAVDYYKRYKESLVKLNKLNGKEEIPLIEHLKIVDFQDKAISLETEPNAIELKPKFSFGKLKQITDEGLLQKISQQVHGIQVHSFKLLQEFSDRLSEIVNQMKLSDESGDTNLYPVKIQSLFEEIEKKILVEEEQQQDRITNFMTNLSNVMINEKGTPVLMKESMPEGYENYKKINDLKINEMESKIKELELKKMHEENKNQDLTKTITNDQATINELKSILSQLEKKNEEKDKETEKLSQKVKQLEMAAKRMEKQHELKVAEILAKDKAIAEIKVTSKTTQDKLIKYTNQIQTLEKKLLRMEEEYKTQLERSKLKCDEESKNCDILRNQISELSANLSQSQSTETKSLREENLRLKSKEKLCTQEIDSLKNSINDLLGNRASFEKSKVEEQVYRREMERRDDELTRLKTTINEMTLELNKFENQLTQKNRETSELERLVKQLESKDAIKEYQDEIIKLRESDNSKKLEIEQLHHDLNKALAELKLQEESLFMQQRLLKIRSELIQSLQENEDANKNQICELNFEIGKRSTALNQLNQEISAKTEELENLFSSLGTKNLEVKRQDHIIKLLEETNDRNQKVRVKQEQKIARLENENAELKNFIIELDIPINDSLNTCNDISDEILRPNHNFYENLRRQKRHNEKLIKVKKYKN